MSAESDEAFDERLERMQIRAQNFRELLKDGEEVTIAFQDGEVYIDESYRSKFERQHPKLYGRLMSVEAQMATGFTGYVFAIVVTSIIIFGLQLNWWTGVIGESVNDMVNRMWFFIAASLLFAYLVHWAGRLRGKFVYRRHRPGLMKLIADAQIDRDVLLVMLRDEPDLDNVIRALKLDAAP